MSYPNVKNEDPTLLKITTKDDENRALKIKTEKSNHWKFLNSLNIVKQYFRNK